MGLRTVQDIVNKIYNAVTGALGVELKAGLPAGTNKIGNVAIDQTTPGTTNKVVAEVTGSNTLIDGEKTSTTPGTPVALVAVSTPCKSVAVVAKTTNTDVVYIGGETPKIPFAAGKGISISIDNLNKVYIDPAVSGEGVDYLAEV